MKKQLGQTEEEKLMTSNPIPKTNFSTDNLMIYWSEKVQTPGA